MMSNNLQGFKRYPDFDYYLSKHPGKKINEVVDAVMITHFHLDHCGALPFLTERWGYRGPIFASLPTRCLLPYML